MIRLITPDDLIDTYSKLKQRGIQFITSKFSFNSEKRTKSAFNELDIQSANWWIIPKVQQRWNTMITHDHLLEYEEFTVEKFLVPNKRLKMLSLGSGICSHELKLASFEGYFEEIICMDISEHLLDEAKKIAIENDLNNISFQNKNLYEYEFPENEYDVVFFHASLHHFKYIENVLGEKIKRTLKKNGKLIINEYVGANRLQYPKVQLNAINQAMTLIPKKYRQRFQLNFNKNHIYGSGLLRMILADPSECVESENILPVIKKHYITLYEASFGGNILMSCLKDLAHHFVHLDEEKEAVLQQLFEFEDAYLKHHPSDFVFGIYENKK